jgi:hypothetical protein
MKSLLHDRSERNGEESTGGLTLTERTQGWQQISAWIHAYSAGRSTAITRMRSNASILQKPLGHAYILLSNEEGTYLIELQNEM